MARVGVPNQPSDAEIPCQQISCCERTYHLYLASVETLRNLVPQIFLWGVLLMAQAASRNFTELAILRVLSGAAEATADPAFVLITSIWYTREQQPSRIGYWYL